MSKRITNAQICREALEEFPSHPIQAIARAVYKRHRARFKDVEAVRWCLRAVTPGSMPARRLKKAGPQRRPVEEVTIPPLPVSRSKPWEPFKLRGKRILILSDIHVPFHDTPALECALAHGDAYKPDVILINGDLCDFYAISKYETNPERRNLAGEVYAIREFLSHLRARFPNARIILKLGNHDERWWSYVWRKAPELLGLDVAEFAMLIHAKEHRIEIVGEQRIIRCGHLDILHGHELPKGMINPVNPARGVFLRTVEITIIGHRHQTSEHTETTMRDRLITTWSTGCLCELHPEYARVNKWNHGFATVDMNGDDFNLRNYRIRNGKIL